MLYRLIVPYGGRLIMCQKEPAVRNNAHPDVKSKRMEDIHGSVYANDSTILAS